MAQIVPNLPVIMIQAPNVKIEGTEYARMVEVRPLVIDIPGKFLKIEYLVYPHAIKEDGTIGESMIGKSFFHTESGQFIADNSTIVDTNGEILGKVITPIYEAGTTKLDGQSVIRLTGQEMTTVAQSQDLTEKPWMLEWDYYDNATNSVLPVSIRQLIITKFSQFLNRIN